MLFTVVGEKTGEFMHIVLDFSSVFVEKLFISD